MRVVFLSRISNPSVKHCPKDLKQQIVTEKCDESVHANIAKKEDETHEHEKVELGHHVTIEKTFPTCQRKHQSGKA